LAMGATSVSLKYLFELWRDLSNEQVGKEWACLETKLFEKNALHSSPKTFRSHIFLIFYLFWMIQKDMGAQTWALQSLFEL
jgi:hypothetical protein